MAVDCDRVYQALINPDGERALRTRTVRRAGIGLEILSVKVAGGPRDLEARVRDAAQLFAS